MNTFTQERVQVQIHEPTINEKWTEAYGYWLDSKSDNTRRAYETAWEELMDFTGKMPWEMGSADIEAFVGYMRQQHAKSTVQQRLAAVSSFFSFAKQNYMDFVDGREVPLHYYNPAKAVDRPKVQQYGKAHPLSLAQVRKFLGAIDQETIQGKRDYALMLAYIATGRRNSEIRTLQWKQIEQHDQRIWYRWQGKGCTSGRYELPATIFHAICEYLSSAGRLQDMHPDDYIFTALSDHADRFPGVDHDPGKPLSARYIRDLVKKYARLAGLDPDQLRVHDLRHTAAMLRVEAGDDVQSVCSFLGHSSLRTTSIYLNRVGGRKDNSWSKVRDMLGI